MAPVSLERLHKHRKRARFAVRVCTVERAKPALPRFGLDEPNGSTLVHISQREVPESLSPLSLDFERDSAENRLPGNPRGNGGEGRVVVSWNPSFPCANGRIACRTVHSSLIYRVAGPSVAQAAQQLGP